MIREAIENNRDTDTSFEIKSAEEMDYKDCFDVIFCNSVFQWFKDPQKPVENCYVALHIGGENSHLKLTHFSNLKGKRISGNKRHFHSL